jgi:hypothetical protein
VAAEQNIADEVLKWIPPEGVAASLRTFEQLEGHHSEHHNALQEFEIFEILSSVLRGSQSLTVF